MYLGLEPRLLPPRLVRGWARLPPLIVRCRRNLRGCRVRRDRSPGGCWVSARQASPLPPVAHSAEKLQIVRRRATPQCHGNHVIELQVIRCTTLSTPSRISGKDELLYVIRYPDAGGRTWSCAYCDNRLRHFNPLSFPLLPSDQQCVDLLLVQVVVVPVKALLEPPISTLTDPSERDGNAVLLLTHRSKLISADLRDPIVRFAQLHDKPSPTREKPWRMADGDIFSPSEHVSELSGRADRWQACDQEK